MFYYWHKLKTCISYFRSIIMLFSLYYWKKVMSWSFFLFLQLLKKISNSLKSEKIFAHRYNHVKTFFALLVSTVNCLFILSSRRLSSLSLRNTSVTFRETRIISLFLTVVLSEREICRLRPVCHCQLAVTPVACPSGRINQQFAGLFSRERTNPTLTCIFRLHINAS